MTQLCGLVGFSIRIELSNSIHCGVWWPRKCGHRVDLSNLNLTLHSGTATIITLHR